MNGQTKLVSSTDELLLAASAKDVTHIVLGADLNDLPSIGLLPGQHLRSGSDHHHTLTFRENTDGLQLSSDNTVSALRLIASPQNSAISNDCSVEDLGTIRLHSL